jgi:hypothetical protein
MAVTKTVRSDPSGREFLLEGMLGSFTQRKNVTVTPTSELIQSPDRRAPAKSAGC